MNKLKTKTQSRQTDVRQRCLSLINTIAPTTEMYENVKGWLDDLDFVEIVMQAELQFDCKIEEGEIGIDDFEKVSDLVDWLVNNVTKHSNMRNV